MFIANIKQKQIMSIGLCEQTSHNFDVLIYFEYSI
jgi:hypothetical protein